MSTAQTTEAQNTREALPVLSVKDLRKLLKRGSKVLWVDTTQRREGGEVEAGDVISVYGDSVDLIWLEGYKSRNDTLNLPMAKARGF